MTTESFKQTLAGHRLQLTRGRTETLQVNMGLLCNQTCRHCHLNAGPDRKENMNLETVDQVVDYAHRNQFKTIDITGGAPELNPNLVKLMEDLVPLSAKIMLRSNLSAMNINKNLVQFLEEHCICIVASFPSLNQTQVDLQRGEGSFKKIIDTLKNLNDVGYGHEGSGLELHLVSNPVGAFLPPPQAETERRFRQLLRQKWGIVFNSIFSFANVPIGRFRRWLEETENFDGYMKKLVSAFNPCAIEGLMCRKLVSVSWDGFLYDCDFNLAKGLPLGGSKIHVSEMSGPPEEGSPISANDHCFTCTAGAGFT